MSCYHPLKGFPIGLTNSGKTQYKIVPYSVDHVELRNGKWVPIDCHMRSDAATKAVWDYIQIPCGKCVGCRLDYSRQWAYRCMLELENHAYEEKQPVHLHFEQQEDEPHHKST